MEELTIESVTAIEPDAPEFTEEHKTFLEEHKSDLSDDQLTKYGLTKDADPDKKGIEFEDDGKGPQDPPADPNAPKPPADPGDDMTPEERAKIDKVATAKIAEALAPIQEHQERTRVESEWKDLIGKFPELAPYQAKALRYASHASYKGKPVTQALMDVAGPDVFVRIGSIRERVASEKTNKNRGGGGTPPARTEVKSIGGIPSFKGKTADEVAKIKRDVQAGKYNS